MIIQCFSFSPFWMTLTSSLELALLEKLWCCTCSGRSARPLDKHACSFLNVLVSAACMKGLPRSCISCHCLPRDERPCASLRPQVPGLQRVCQSCANHAQQVYWALRDILSLSAHNCRVLGHSGFTFSRNWRQCKLAFGRIISLLLLSLSTCA